MPAYRFCRSDDVPALVEAYRVCLTDHDPAAPPLSVEGWKRRVREIDLWASSCMLASADGKPIGVLLGAKRVSANNVLTVAVHPGHRGEGHGRHMIESLAQKLAILGPTRIVAEVDGADAAARAFLERCGFARERDYADHARPALPGEPGPFDPWIATLELSDLERAGVLAAAAPRPWARSVEHLARHRDRLVVLGLVAGDRIEGWLVADDGPDEAERLVLALGAADPARAEPLLAALVFRAASGGRVLRFPRVAPGEVVPGLLTSLGFTPGAQTIGYAVEAGKLR